MKKNIATTLGGIALFAAAASAAASCGSAFCVLNTNWSTQGVASDPGSFRLDERFEFVDQKNLRHGMKRISRDDAAGEDATELRTINRNLLTTLDYTLSKNWAVSASVSALDRSHSHIDNATGDSEKWDFRKIGDTRVLGMYRFDNDANPASYGLSFGLKLPTGSTRVANSDGVTAERALQPGTGSTDLVLGGFYSTPGAQADSSWFAQVLYQQALSIKDDFRPGRQFQLNVGYRYPLTHDLQALLQVNTSIKDRDSGANAEPELSGSRLVFLSPGLSYALTPDVQLYGFVQLPVYRNYNGIQLAVDWTFVAGATLRF